MALSEISVEQLANKIYNAIGRGSLDAVRDAIVEFLEVVLQGLGMYCCRGFAEALNYLLDFLVRRFQERVQEWIENALRYGLNVAFEREDRNAVRNCCQSDQQFMDNLDSIRKKAALKHGLKSAGKGAVREAVKKGAKEVVKQATKQVVVKQATKQVTKQAAKQATKQGAKSVAKIVAKGATPWALAADAAQFGLEATGHETAGKAVGASGNIVFGAMAAGAIAGPPGAVIGAVVGGGIWAFGEGLGNAAGSVIDWFW